MRQFRFRPATTPGLRFVLTTILLPALIALVLPAPSHGQAKELIAVIDLRPVGATEIEASALTDRLREELLRTGKFTLVDRSQMENVLNEQALQQAGCTEQECAVQVGRILGVRKIIAGKITRISTDLWQLSTIMVDVETAETQRAESIQHRGDFFTLLTAQVPPLAAKLAATGSASVAVPAPVPPSPATAEPMAASGVAAPKWPLYAGWGLVAAAALNQIGAWQSRADAEEKEKQALEQNDLQLLSESQDLDAEADASQSAAILLGGAGAGVLVWYYRYLVPGAQGTAAAGWEAPAQDRPLTSLRVAVQPGRLLAGWRWRW